MPSNRPRTSRRSFVVGLTGVLFATAGCLGSNDDGTTDSPSNTPTASETAIGEPSTSTPTQTTQATETAQSPEEADSINPSDEEEGPAEFSVTAVHAPEQTQIGVKTLVELEIKNVGGEAGSLTSGISFSQRTDRSPWTGLSESIEMEFDAGETKTYSCEIAWPFVETVFFRFDELHTTVEIEFRERVLPQNEAYQTPLGIELEVDDVGSQSHYTYTDRDGTERKRFPYEENAKFLYVEITATNVADELVETPNTRDFFVTNSLDGGDSYGAERIYRDGADWKFPSETRLNAGESVSGKLLFKAATETQPDDIAFGIAERIDEGEYRAYWTP